MLRAVMVALEAVMVVIASMIYATYFMPGLILAILHVKLTLIVTSW